GGSSLRTKDFMIGDRGHQMPMTCRAATDSATHHDRMTMDSRTAETLEWDALRARMAGWAACSLGEARLKALAPLESPAAVHDRLERVAELIALIERNGRVPLGGLEDIGDVVAAAAPMGVALGPEGWTRLLRFLGVVQRIADFAAEHDETLPRLREMAGRLHP